MTSAIRSRLFLIQLLFLVQISFGQNITVQFERSVEAGFYYPTDICGNERGDVFVLDGMNDRVVEINAAGQVRSIRPNRGTIYKAVGIACIDNKIWIADTPRSRILELGKNGRINQVIPLEAWTEPVDLVGINNQIAVSDRANHRIILVDSNGKISKTWGNRGNGLGEFINPGLLAAGPENRLIIPDILNRRVLSYSPSGRFPQMIAKPGAQRGQIIRPKGVAMNTKQQVWISDSFTGVLQLFSLSGKYLGIAAVDGKELRLKAPMGIWLDKNNRIWVVESSNDRVSVYRLRDE
ncbi:MAG: hypothetical protein K9M49_08150 [Candidatus Marinimicrobia bacterium]|nr:hypothetical protein [Candidatus Neomarinimicrobiota bacterium]MCF7850855.1 hypothetical protein [Candidatus Neomarinimicrobiota bacterium]MCF7905110.1 hypothetical protein [Candidatus Neomarinimicrobiota bacterium]